LFINKPYYHIHKIKTGSKKMKKTAKFGIVALLLVALVTSAFAFGGRGIGNEEAREALEAGDYGAWKEAMASGLTEDRFNKMRERHENMQEKRAEMEEAIEQGYDAWKELVEETPHGEKLLEIINEGNFDRFVEMHEARKDGDHETAKEIAEELGLKGPGKGFGKGRRPRCNSE